MNAFELAAQAIREELAALAPDARMLVTLDGACATGKTTLASALGASFDAAVLHTDDFVVPHPQKTRERLSIPGGNCDWERLTSEALIPWKRGVHASYRRYDFMVGDYAPPEPLPAQRVLILEGSYANLPAIRALADVCLFLQSSWETREQRLRERESPQSLARFYSLWIPLEDAYFAAYHLPDDRCVLLQG